VVLLHGYPQTHVAWHAVAPRLAERHRRRHHRRVDGVTGDPDRRAAIYLRYGLEIVGPPPAP
jgi:pimeloyl-ACP methyl ester carboxylesterase